jgi:dienelactone hydrolase
MNWTALRRSLTAAALATTLLAPSSASAQYEPGFVAGTGKWPAIMEMQPNLPTHTIYRPKSIAGLGFKLPVVVYAEGGCRNIGNKAPAMLAEIASHGYLVIALGPISPYAKPVNYDRSDDIRAADGFPATSSTAQMPQAVDWAIGENKRAGSPFHGKIDEKMIAYMGRSCGGLQAIAASLKDPRVKATLIMNSGMWADDDKRNAKVNEVQAGLTKASLRKLRAPALYIYGGATDMAYANSEDDLNYVAGAPVFAASHCASGHPGTFGDDNGGAFGKVGVAWLDLWLKRRGDAAKLFKGKDCGLCADPAWVVRRPL